MGYKYRVVEIGEYVLIIQREKNICFKMKKKEFEEEGDIKIREIIDGISKMRKKYDVTFPENKKQMNTIYLFVTDYCNLNCEFCAMRSNNKDIKKEKLSQLEVKEHVIDKIRKANPRKLIVSGGEPFVLEDILDILKELKENISQVHFIKLILKDEKGKDVSSNFYWRSNDKYEGSKTLTGPAASGFEDLSKLKQAKVKLTYKVREDDNNYFVDITLRNTSGQIAFFNQLQFLNSKMSPIRPSFYTDNFFSLMPGEKKTVTIETAKGKLKDGAVLALKGWNINKQEYKLK